MDKLTKKIMLAVILILVVLLSVGIIIFLNGRKEIPEDTLLIIRNGKEEYLSLSDMELKDFTGKTVNGKGEEKEITGKGIRLSDITGSESFSEINVTADDSYSATVNSSEIENAWIQVDEGMLRLIVFGDKDSKRNVKNVVKIEVK